MERKRIINFWPIFVIFFLVAAFFWKFFVKGMVPLPADITVGMYFPWLDYKWGYSVGVPVKNPFLSDVISQYYPFQIYAIEQIRKGFLPLWNSSLFWGYPLFANIQTGIFNPTNIFYLFFSNITAWGLETFFQPLLAAIFTFIFLRSLKISRWASILGGITYAFTGFNVIWMETSTQVFAAAYLPLLFYSVNRYFEKNQFKYGFLTSFALALQIFSGYPQVVIYSLLAVGLFMLYRGEIFKKRNWLIFIFFGFGVILASIQIIPTMELFVNAQRHFETGTYETYYLPWKNFISLLAPDYFGNPATGNYYGTGDYSTINGYSGLVAIVLAGVALIAKRKNKTVRFLFLLLVFSLLLAFPTPFSWLLFKTNFFGLGNSAASRILFLTNFSFACLAAFGFDCLIKQKFEKKYFRALYFPSIVIGGYFLGTTFLLFFNHVYRESIIGLRNLVLPILFLFLTSLSFMVLSFKPVLKKVIATLIFILLVGEIFRFGWKFIPFSKKELVFPETPVLTYLKQKEGIFRVEGGDAVPMNMLTPYGLESLSAYDPLYPLRTAQMLALVNDSTFKQPRGRYGTIDTYSSRLFDLSNVCYLLAVKRDEKARPNINGSPSYRFAEEKLTMVFSDKSVIVLENKNCYPRAFLAYDYLVEGDEAKVEKILKSKDFNPRKTIILEKTPVNKNRISKSKNSHLEWLTYRPGFEQIRVKTDSPSLLFMSESFYPGWEVFIDNNKSEILKADYNFKSVFIPSGDHLVKFVYNPLSFKIGAILSGLGFLTLTTGLIFSGLKIRKN